MNRIKKLIGELCPGGVEFKQLGEVCKFQRGISITKKDVSDGDVPVIAGGQKPSYYHNKPNRTGETIAISGSGAYAGFVSFWTTPVFLSDSFSVNPDSKVLVSKYVFYFLKNLQDEIHAAKKGGGVPHVHGSDLAKFRIPTPPLPIQEEIVRILDTFTELEAELEARQKQYEYYRTKLLTFSEQGGVRWMALGEIGTMVRGNGLQKKDFTETGVGCIHYGQIYTYYGTFADKTKSFVSKELAGKLRKAAKGDLVIATTSENVEDVCKAVAWLGDEPVAVSGDAYIFRHSENPKYMSYLFQTPLFQDQKKRMVTGTKVVRVSGDSLAKIRVPLPSRDEQNRTVSILDKFEVLVNDISVGLPAELTARRKQYEYYRNQLLTFKEYAG